jgi:PadR family transcriptional regulator, regulatory protein PadR
MNELGKFELPVLAAVARLRGTAYGVSVMDEVSRREGREVAYGAVHVTLDRLVEKGFVTSKMGEPSLRRGGRRKRFYELTGKGEAALSQAWSRHQNTLGSSINLPIRIKQPNV